jgi:ADP-ribose pyrophosphatase
MPITPWKILSSTHVYKDVRIDRVELPDGKFLEGFVLEYHDWVTVVALTSDQQVVMERQYRHGIQQTILELPGGAMEPDEHDPLAAAKRELLEETGYSSDRFIELGKVCPNPANQVNYVHYFLALDAKKTSAQHLDDTEEIEVELISFNEVVEIAKRGELLQAMQVGALFFALAWLKKI